MRALLRSGAASAALLACLAVSARADAWCRTAGCEQGVGARCVPELPTDCGEELGWKAPCLGYAVHEGGTRLASLARVRELIAAGFAQWTDVDCAGAAPGLAVVEVGTIACDQQGYVVDGPNSNLVVFRDDDWPYPARALALTTVTYGLDDARIRDADIEVNTVSIGFTFDDSDPKYDFQSIITHEAGHFLGLAHSSLCDQNEADPDCPTDDDIPTMILAYDRGSTLLRSLAPDDAAGICDVYPPGDIGACEPEFDGGLQGECASGEAEEPVEEGGCCTVAPGASSRRSAGPAIVLLLAGLGSMVVRRRSRQRPRSWLRSPLRGSFARTPSHPVRPPVVRGGIVGS